MIRNDELGAIILANFPHNATNDQRMVVGQWSEFLLSRSSDSVFLLSGYAGTGKTSLMGALVKTLRQLQQQVVLMAPTGRAAKVFSMYAEAPAHTIHRCIYRQKSLDVAAFQVNVNLHRHTLFIVDEASMIGQDTLGGAVFGTGRLLDDLVQFVYSGEGCRLLLVGDTAQLPPVGETLSPAMLPSVLEGYGLKVQTAVLTEVVRQVEDSGILWNATFLRELLRQGQTMDFPPLRLTGFPDIANVSGGELSECLEQSYYQVGVDETIVVTRSNKQANVYNMEIRARVFGHEEELCSSDRIIVAKNNYYWIEQAKKAELAFLQKKGEETDGQAPVQQPQKRKEADDFIANGDMALIHRLRNNRSFYGFHFADATITLLDHDEMELDVTLLLDALHSEAPALTREQQEKLFQEVWADYPDITNKRDRMKRLREDPYFNALQVKYAYAVTCHKAQGGQWQRVFVDQGYVTTDMLSPDYFRWLYTAITRATEKVYLVNWAKEGDND